MNQVSSQGVLVELVWEYRRSANQISLGDIRYLHCTSPVLAFSQEVHHENHLVHYGSRSRGGGRYALCTEVRRRDARSSLRKSEKWTPLREEAPTRPAQRRERRGRLRQRGNKRPEGCGYGCRASRQEYLPSRITDASFLTVHRARDPALARLI